MNNAYFVPLRSGISAAWANGGAWLLVGLAGAAAVLPVYAAPTALALTGLALVVGTLFLARPAVPFFLSIALISFRSIQISLTGDERITASMVEPLLIVCVACWMIARCTGRAEPYPGTVSDLPLTLLFLLNCLSLIWTSDLPLGEYITAMLLFGLMLYFLTIVHLRSFRAVKIAAAIFIVLAVAAGVSCFYVLYSKGEGYSSVLYDNRLFWIGLQYNPEAQLRGQGFMHPLRTSYYLSLATIISLVYVATTAGYRRWLASLLSFFIFCALITTLSKGPMISLFAGLFVLSLAIPRLRRRFILTWVGIAALLVLGFLVGRLPTGNVTKSLNYTIDTATDQDNETSSLGSRLIRWRQGLRALYDTWGMGTGAGGFYPYTEPYFLFDNVYMHMLVEYGFTGACIYLWLLVAAAKRFVGAYARCRVPALRTWMLFYLAGFVTLVCNGLTSENQLFLSFWFYLGFGHALSRIAEEGSPPPAGLSGFPLRLDAQPA